MISLLFAHFIVKEHEYNEYMHIFFSSPMMKLCRSLFRMSFCRSMVYSPKYNRDDNRFSIYSFFPHGMEGAVCDQSITHTCLKKSGTCFVERVLSFLSVIS